MRPASAAPGVLFVNLPLRQSPNACAGDCRGILDPVVPYKPPLLRAESSLLNLGRPRGGVNVILIATPRFSRLVTGALQPWRATAAMVRDTDRLDGAGCVGGNGIKVGQPIWEAEEERFR